MDSVLLIDDEKDNLDALHRLLRSDFDVKSTTSPLEALKTLQKEEFAVIVSDQRMPEMTGVDLLEKAKSISPASTRILLTGYTDIAAVIDAINRGNIYRYIAKPWDSDDLKITLRQAAEAYRLKKELGEKNVALSKANDELKEAYEDLRLLDRAKARFLSLISHELNTPLTVIQSFSQLLSENKKDLPGDIQKAIDSMHSASSRFSEIVEEVLLYTRLVGEDQFGVQDFDLKNIIEDAIKQNKEVIKQKKITLNTTATEKNTFRGDAEKLGTAISKLIHDTLERCPTDSEVRLGLKVGSNQAVLTVWRLGEAITDESFEPLESTKDELHHHQGLGLGLAICRVIVEGHGGELDYESDETKGTLIILTLNERN